MSMKPSRNVGSKNSGADQALHFVNKPYTIYSETRLKWPLKKDKRKALKTGGS